MTRTRTGVWFVGARGNAATTASTGTRGIARGAMDAGTVTTRDSCIAERSLHHTVTECVDSGGDDIGSDADADSGGDR